MKPAKPPKEKRQQLLVYLYPSLKARIDRDRERRGQSRSVWIERACEAMLKGTRHG